MRNRRRSREAMPPGFDVADLFPETEAEARVSSRRDLCASLIASFDKGGEIEVDGTRWRVETSYGVTKYLVKAGTKGKKLYTLRVTDTEDCCVEVLEVWPGSGDIKKDVPPAAVGCLRAGK